MYRFISIVIIVGLGILLLYNFNQKMDKGNKLNEAKKGFPIIKQKMRYENIKVEKNLNADEVEKKFGLDKNSTHNYIILKNGELYKIIAIPKIEKLKTREAIPKIFDETYQ